ncbi:MAG: BatD family protein [Fibrobacter sp.]|jgi:hypothetical protein|nr:BatD family protein [Fibrobacter sp.]
MMKVLVFFLFLAVTAQARMSLEFDRDRIEAGKPFEIRLVVPVPELADSRGVPRLSLPPEIQSRGLDSLDTQETDFFGRGFQVRKYSFKLTAPKKTGRYLVGPLSWMIGGTEYEIQNRIAVTVQRSYDDAAVVVSLTPAKQTVYEGEQFSLQLNIHTFEHFQGELSALSMDLGNDFIAHRADLSNLQFKRLENTPGEMEAKTNFAWIAPVKSGELTIPPFRFKYMKQGPPKVVEENKSGGGFSMSFKSIRQASEEAEAASAPVRIRVLPLPATNRPQNFSGMVGNYSFSGDFDKTELKVGDALTLSMVIKGDGKPGTISDPELPDFSEFRAVPPEVNLSKKESGNKVITTKEIKVFLYPKKKGEFHVPEITYHWFDPAAKQYRKKTLGPWDIKVEKGDASEIPAYSGGAVSQKDIESLGNDIRHIRTGALKDSGKLPYREIHFWVLLALPFLLYPLFVWLILKRRRDKNDAILMRKSRARKNLQVYTKKAKEALQSGNFKEFYALLENALIGYLSDLSNREFRGMTREALQTNLEELGFKETDITEIRKWLNKCDEVCFAPVSHSQAEGEKALHTFETLCETLEVLR